jgi:predicted DCC family thiol-disulfide oxidoreductase YuxK
MRPAPLLLYDGSCAFCSWWARQILRLDRRRRFRLASLGSATGRELLRASGLPEDFEDSIVLRSPDGRTFTRSGAALRIAHELGWPWRALGVLRAVPRPVRDAAYDAIARRRRRIPPPGHACPVRAEGEGGD